MDIGKKKQKWLDLYQGKERTAVVIEQKDYGTAPFLKSPDMNEFFDWNIRRCRLMLDSLDWLDDDLIPHVSLNTGTHIFAEAFGCPVLYPGDTNPYARPCVFCANDLLKIKQPELESSSLMKILEFGLKLKKAAPLAMIQLPDIQSPLDIAAIIWDKTDFYSAMIDEPQAVKDLMEMVYLLLTQFLDLWFKTFGKEFIAHYPAYYMPYGITLSEDEIGSISAGQFKEFAWPLLCRLSAQYGGKIGIHCCADAKHQWGLLKSIPGLTLFNFSPHHNIENAAREASVFFRDGPPLWLRGPDMNGYHDFRSRAVLLGKADSKEEAIEVLKRLRDYSARFRAV
ncbi:MAG: hypothetical protein FWD78_01630 [Treponema sp.]|nr:hypothetical protein [Treponema sp.]